MRWAKLRVLQSRGARTGTHPTAEDEQKGYVFLRQTASGMLPMARLTPLSERESLATGFIHDLMPGILDMRPPGRLLTL